MRGSSAIKNAVAVALVCVVRATNVVTVDPSRNTTKASGTCRQISQRRYLADPLFIFGSVVRISEPNGRTRFLSLALWGTGHHSFFRNA